MAWRWRPYVSAARRRTNGLKHAKTLQKQGRELAPVNVSGRSIATTVWGRAWCDNIERFSDYENRLPRGRTYARNGSILDLQITKGKVTAIVCGSDIYNVRIDIDTLPADIWKKIIRDCSTSVSSLFDLLQGKLSGDVMERLTRQKEGLFPHPTQIRIACSCPDWAGLCKHAAAVLYGVGARLDSRPELLFLLRNVDHEELILHAAAGSSLEDALTASGDSAILAGSDLSELFGIELDSASGTVHGKRKPAARAKTPRAGKVRLKNTTSTAKMESPGKRSTGRKRASGLPKTKSEAATTRKASGSTKQLKTSPTTAKSKKSSRLTVTQTADIQSTAGRKKRKTSAGKTASPRKSPANNK